VTTDLQSLTRPDPRCVTRCTLELTDRCNLRCIYCHQNFPAERQPAQRNLTPDQLAEAVAFFGRNRIGQVALTGGGETTFYPGWERYLETLLAAGTGITMTTNFTRKFSDAEWQALLKFSNLDVSLDCLDPDVTARIRKGANLGQIVFNIASLKGELLKRGLTRPTLSLSSVVYAEMVPGFARLVDFAVLMGIGTIHLQDFVNYGWAADNVTSLWSLTGTEARDQFTRFRDALDEARRRGIVLKIGSGLDARLRAMNDYLDAAGVQELAGLGPSPEGWSGGGAGWNPDPGAPLTRDCTDPWDTLQIFGDGTARMCCFHAMQVGPFGPGRTLEELWHDPRAQDLRERLLTGNLDDSCRHCNMRGLTAPDALLRKVAGKYFPEPAPQVRP